MYFNIILFVILSVLPVYSEERCRNLDFLLSLAQQKGLNSTNKSLTELLEDEQPISLYSEKGITYRIWTISDDRIYSLHTLKKVGDKITLSYKDSNKLEKKKEFDLKHVEFLLEEINFILNDSHPLKNLNKNLGTNNKAIVIKEAIDLNRNYKWSIRNSRYMTAKQMAKSDKTLRILDKISGLHN